MTTGNVPFQRAVGTARLAIDFVEAAASLKPRSIVEPPSMVGYFLVGHALELAYKSVLIVGGITEHRLRRIGHDLKQCRSKAAAVYPDLGAESLLESIAPLYRAKAFEYLQPGYRSLPEQGYAIATADKVVMKIWQWVDDSVRTKQASLTGQ